MSRFNTGNPLGSGSPLDLDDNAKNMDLAVNAEQDTFQDRLGKNRLTWAGMESGFGAGQVSREQRFRMFIVSSGYQFLGDYAAGLEITEYNQLVRDENGEFWRVSGQVDLPYVTTGAGIPEGDALVPAGDAALRQELANGAGAGLVGYGESTVAQALDGIFSQIPISSRDYDNLSDALNSGEKVITIPRGLFTFSEGITVTSSELSEIRGNGDTVLDFSESSSGLIIESELIELPDPLVVGKRNTIQFPLGSDISEGDVLILWNPSASSLNKYREYYRDGFMARVSKVRPDGSVMLFGTIPDCNLSTVNAYKLSNNNPFRISGVKIIPPAGGIGLHVKCRQRVFVESSVSLGSGGYTGIEIERCFDISVNSPDLAAVSGNAYPIIISNSQNYRINGMVGNSTRHSIGLGGRAEVGSVPTRDGVISNCILENDAELGIGAADVHGNVVGVSYVNCIINSHAHIAGRDVRYSDCVIYGRQFDHDGMCIYGSEVAGGTMEILDCTFVMNDCVTTNNYGIIHLINKFQTHELSVVIRGLTLKGVRHNGDAGVLFFLRGGIEFDKGFRVSMEGIDITEEVSLNRLMTVAGGDENPATQFPSKIFIKLPDDLERFNHTVTVAETFPNPENIRYSITGEFGSTTATGGEGNIRVTAKDVTTKIYPRPPSVRVSTNSAFASGGRITMLGADGVTKTGFTIQGATLDTAYSSDALFQVDYEVYLKDSRLSN